MSAQRDADESLLTIDELSALVGLTVRTARYYATLGLIPPPIRRGRIAYYDQGHVARLRMVRALQDHGFTLQAIEGYMATLDPEAAAEELELQRAMLVPWSPTTREEITRSELEERAGRKLSRDDVAALVRLGAVTRVGRRYAPSASFRVGVELISLGIPLASMVAAGAAIRDHIGALAQELTEVMRSQVIAPFRSREHTPEEAKAFEAAVGRLRQLTIESVVIEFQSTANELIAGSLLRASDR